MARIAVIDRRADVLALSQAVLVGRGHAVVSFSTLAAALEELSAKPPDAVIAGAFEGRPATSRDLVEKLEGLGPAVLVFLLVQGRGDERAVLEGLDAGAHDVITVPFSATDLAGRVAAGLGRRAGREAPAHELIAGAARRTGRNGSTRITGPDPHRTTLGRTGTGASLGRSTAAGLAGDGARKDEQPTPAEREDEDGDDAGENGRPTAQAIPSPGPALEGKPTEREASETRVFAPPQGQVVRARSGGPTRRGGLSPVTHASVASSDDDEVVPNAPALNAARVSILAAAGEEDQIVGRAFDRYILTRTLGVGGMGVVLEAEHAKTGARVALKILREDVAKDRDAAMRFLREAYVLQAIDDRNVVRIVDIGRQGGRLFYAMELVRGENLAQKLDREGRIGSSETCRIAAGVARALAALARRGIVHRDVKPGNIFLGLKDEVKLGDFGLAKRAFARCVTPVREPLGTPHYLAPEVVSGGNATPLSDVYSLGVVIHEMLSGNPPFDGRDTMVLLYKVCHGPPVEVEKTLAHVPNDLRQLVARSIARDPRARYPDAAALARSLERLRMRLRA